MAIKATIKMELDRVRGSKFLMMVAFTKGNGRLIWLMATGSLHITMGVTMKGNSRKIVVMVRESQLSLTATHIKVNGKRICNMALVKRSGNREDRTKGIINLGRSMVWVRIYGLMVVGMKETG